MTLHENARAKINLFLHVGSARADGYHPIESLAVFADAGDELTFEPGTATFSITVTGPFAQAAGEPANNLVLKAAHALQKKVPSIQGGAFALTKNIPAGAGLGGGSADAAAALRILAQLHSLSLNDPAVKQAAVETGADVAVCLAQKARIVSGIGETLSEPVTISPLPAVLVWPGAPASTPAVYRAFDDATVRHATEFGVCASDIPNTREALLEFLTRQNNDLARAAQRITPNIMEAEAALRTVDRTLLIRMSGSGSTMFALYASLELAHEEAAAITAKYPDWWVKATMLG